MKNKTDVIETLKGRMKATPLVIHGKHSTNEAAYTDRRTSKVRQINSIQFSIQFFISFHTEQYNMYWFQVIYGINKLFIQSICFQLIIRDIGFVYMHVLWK